MSEPQNAVITRVVDVARRVLSEQVSPGQMVLLGVSGGPDSLCLLDVAVRLREEMGIGLHVVHVNHLLRGAESAEDEACVTRLARQVGVGVTAVRWDTRAHQKRSRRSLEDTARQLRHRTFLEVGHGIGAVAVLLAHTADDLAETVLMRMIRGTGVRGLAGIRMRSEVLVPDVPEGRNRLTLVRPLLDVWRAETVSYCAAAGLDPRIDSTNAEPFAQRNRVRRRILPLLERENPRVREALVRLAQSAALESDFLEQQVDRLWPVAAEAEDGEVVLLSRELLAAPPVVRRRLLVRAIERATGPTDGGPELPAVDRLEQALCERAGMEVHLPGVRATVEYGKVRLSVGPPATGMLPEITGEVALAVPGTTRVGEWLVRAEIRPADDLPAARPGRGRFACFDLDRLGEKLIVRTRRPGDRFVPTGMAQTKKLQDFFTDEKVPRRLRDRVPLLVAPEGVAWVVGWRQDARFLPGQATRRVIEVRFERQR